MSNNYHDPYLPALLTPEIKTSDQLDTDINKYELRKKLYEQVLTDIRTPKRRTGPREGVIRNGRCPCGSGRKYKKCCM